MQVVRKSPRFVALLALVFWVCPAVWGQSDDVTEVIVPLTAEPARPATGVNTPSVGGGQIRIVPKQSQQSKQDPCQLARQRFVQSALFYDANRDELLAYHETHNLLLALGRSQFAGQNQVAPANNVDAASAFDAQDQEVANRQLNAFVGVFMELSRQFDSNGDSQLSSGELLGFADMLIQFDPSLAGEECLRSRANRTNRNSRSTPQSVAQRQTTQQQIQQLPATQIQGNGTTAYNLCPSNGSAAAATNSSVLNNVQSVPLSPASSNGTSSSTTSPSIPGLQSGFSGAPSESP